MQEIYFRKHLKDIGKKDQKQAGKAFQAAFSGLSSMRRLRREVSTEDWAGRSSNWCSSEKVLADTLGSKDHLLEEPHVGQEWPCSAPDVFISWGSPEG